MGNILTLAEGSFAAEGRALGNEWEKALAAYEKALLAGGPDPWRLRQDAFKRYVKWCLVGLNAGTITQEMFQ